MGAWIETSDNRCSRNTILSRPPWARGLKLTAQGQKESQESVAPPVGAWIETGSPGVVNQLLDGRAPRGRVD